jgi:hypothetical protein
MGEYTQKMLTGFAVVVLLATGCDSVQEPAAETPEGIWVCTTAWTYDDSAGVTVPSSAVEHTTCVEGVLSVTGVISLGAAQWSEEKVGTCYASGQELYGAWTSTKTTTKNDAARQFEREKLEGRSLGSAVSETPQNYRVQVFFRTETQFKAINGEGRLIACQRP